jgi:hypothetical protein
MLGVPGAVVINTVCIVRSMCIRMAVVTRGAWQILACRWTLGPQKVHDFRHKGLVCGALDSHAIAYNPVKDGLAKVRTSVRSDQALSVRWLRCCVRLLEGETTCRCGVFVGYVTPCPRAIACEPSVRTAHQRGTAPTSTTTTRWPRVGVDRDQCSWPAGQRQLSALWEHTSRGHEGGPHPIAHGR